MNIEGHLAAGWRLLWEDPLFVIAGGLIVQVVNIASLGVCTGPVLGGYVLCLVLRLRDGTRLDFGELFCGFQRFGALFPYAVVPLLTVIGFVFFIVPGVVLLTWWIYVLPLMAERRLPLAEAMALSRERVRRGGFWRHLLFVAVITMLPNLILNSAMVFLPFVKILQVLVMPFQCACLASLYVEAFGPRRGASRLEQHGGDGTGHVRRDIGKAYGA